MFFFSLGWYRNERSNQSFPQEHRKPLRCRGRRPREGVTGLSSKFLDRQRNGNENTVCTNGVKRYGRRSPMTPLAENLWDGLTSEILRNFRFVVRGKHTLIMRGILSNWLEIARGILIGHFPLFLRFRFSGCKMLCFICTVPVLESISRLFLPYGNFVLGKMWLRDLQTGCYMAVTSYPSRISLASWRLRDPYLAEAVDRSQA